MKARWLYWTAAIAGIGAPFLVLPDGSSRDPILFGAAPLSVLSVALGFAHGRSQKPDWVDQLSAFVWLVAAVAVSLPILESMPHPMSLAQALAAGAGTASLVVVSVRAAQSRLPLALRLLRSGGALMAALILARAGLRLYASLDETLSQGVAAIVAEAYLFAGAILACAAALAVGVVGEKVWSKAA